MLRVPIKPELLRWARVRAGYSVAALSNRFKKLADWERGAVQPTLKQLEGFAKATYVPIGYLFLDHPPREQLPIPDLRTVGNRAINHPSPELLDTIYLCQQRQEWYRDFAHRSGYARLDFVGSANQHATVESTAEQMRTRLKFDLEARRQSATWTDALRQLIEKIDAAGIMVMLSGVVGSNTQRQLDAAEFRGFALSDARVPLVFVNGADSKAAQMFTLAHELAHIWLGETALSDTSPRFPPSQSIEIWCNKVAAELLVPLANIKLDVENIPPPEVIPALTRKYKVSTLVMLRRLFDIDYFSKQQFNQHYAAELTRLRQQPISRGGNFLMTTIGRVGKRFAYDLIASTLEGQTSFTEALRLLGIKKMATFNKISTQLGISV